MVDFNASLGLQAGSGDSSVTLATGPEHEIAPGTVHFAVLATIAEVAAARAVGSAVVPASLTLNLLRRARPGALEGRGVLLRKGARLAVAEGEVRQDGELVAKATVTFALTG
jgi:acyl-coenzyme A thioesterase PaaI-like protein